MYSKYPKHGKVCGRMCVWMFYAILTFSFYERTDETECYDRLSKEQDN